MVSPDHPATRRLAAALLLIGLVVAAMPSPSFAQDGATLFKTYCSTCHEPADPGAPTRDVLSQMRPEQILQALETGAMRRQAAERSHAQRRTLAEYLTGRELPAGVADVMPPSAFCDAASDTSRPAAGGVWNGWGNGVTNQRFQSAEAAGMSADDVSHLTLKWAFGLPRASSAGTQPVVLKGRLYIATAEGDLYVLDAKTGCVHWTIEAEAGIRTAMTLEQRDDGGLTAYFGDQSANVYAVDATSGELRWKVEVDEHPHAAITGAPQLHGRRLYVPVSSREESQVGDKRYQCCRFRGSVVALDRETGQQLWKTYTIDRSATPTEKNSIGTQLFGPSGAAVWNTPTIDSKRDTLYVGTGNNFSPPASDASDAIVALDLTTGDIRWIHQITADDIWNASCRRPDRDPAVCPDAEAPDYDFPGSPILVDLADGRQLVVAGNKDGMIYALDPDGGGATVWKQRVARPGAGGGVFWGPAVDDANVYGADAYYDATNPGASGGLAAVELSTGGIVWQVPGAGCGERSPCRPSQKAAVTVIPGAVFSGTVDGRLRAYSTNTGTVIWEYDSVREFTTVNGVRANGGSMSNGGPVVVDGMLYVNSGYSHHGAILPGNVLLAFAPE
jgi:polyvinyl alcohol dehydrogenase (cytochrome)